MAKEQIMAAGGIVLRRESPPRIAVVRLRKRDEWVLPKGKLDDGETPRDAAKREVLEETGHNVTVHEFLGTLVVDSGTRTKVVHYWRMEAAGEATRPLMDDIRAVDWLPLDAAVERLSRSHEKSFLENVGPYALAGLIRRTRAKAADETATASKPVAKAATSARSASRGAAKPATRKRRTLTVEPAEPMPAPASLAAPTEIAPAEIAPAEIAPVDNAAIETAPSVAAPISATMDDGSVQPPPEAEADAPSTTADQPPVAATPQQAEISDVERVQAVAVSIRSMISAAPARESATSTADMPAMAAATTGGGDTEPVPGPVTVEVQSDAVARDDHGGPQRRTLAQKVRGWFGRAA